MRGELKPHRSRARIWAAGWGIFLLAVTSWPKPPVVPLISGIPHIDKFTHFVLYAVQAYLLYRSVAWPGRGGFSLARSLTVVGALAIWGTADEVHQHWIPGRGMDAADFAADLAGAAAGAITASLGTRRRRCKRGSTS